MMANPNTLPSSGLLASLQSLLPALQQQQPGIRVNMAGQGRPALPAPVNSMSMQDRGPFGAEPATQRAIDEAARLPVAPNNSAGPQQFDYQAALARLIPQEKKPSTLQKIADVLGVIGASLSGDKNQLIPHLMRQKAEQENRRWQTNKLIAEWMHSDWAQQRGSDLRAAAPFTIGRNRLRYDPATGDTQTLFHGPADFEDYAAAKGLEPGTEDYFKAVEDYVLRGNGPSALGNDKQLDDYRTGNRTRLEQQRQGNRMQMEGVRQGNRMKIHSAPSYRDTHPQSGRAPSTALPTVRTPEEAMRLPSGTKFRTPDGRVKVRP